MYPYIENLNKSFIIQAGQNCFVKENIFGTETIRRLTMCMVRNSHFRGTTTASTPFSDGRFGLQMLEFNAATMFLLPVHQWITATVHVYVTTQYQHWASTGVAIEF